MRGNLLFLLLSSLFALSGKAQSRFSIIVKDSTTSEILPGANAKFPPAYPLVGTADIQGKIFLPKVLEGRYEVTISCIGYQEKKYNVEIPIDTLLTALLQPDQRLLEEITVAATRTNARIEDAPMKAEVLGLEEMDEENGIKPGNITSLLGDISGIQIQQSSAVSGNANVRIQGLGGEYTQILRDGLPLYEGFSGGFGILQVPPIDLKQIEIIKGSASTLYGGGAIGGIINLVSKEPSEKPEGLITLNQSSLTERNFNGYCSVKKNKRGASIFSGVTYQNAFDVNKDGFSDVPKIQNLIIHPRLLFYLDTKTTLAIGFSSTYETRRGGDMEALKNNRDSLHTFYQEDKTDRNTGDIVFTHTSSSRNLFTVKGSGSFFDRNLLTNKYRFYATQVNGYGEVSYLIPRAKNDLVMGVNVWTTSLEKNGKDSALMKDYTYQTIGTFIQTTYKPGEKLFLEAGLRTDYHSRYGLFVLPRLAGLYKFNEKWYSRAGIAMGYVTPNPFAEQNTEYHLNKIAPIPDSVKEERSLSSNLEVNYKKRIGKETFLYLNHAFFYTQINKPVIAATDSTGVTSFHNGKNYINSMGWDTYLRMSIEEWEIYFGYTYTMARQEYNAIQPYVTYTPRNRAAILASYEIKSKWRFGMEGSYTGFQYREDGTKTPDYIFVAAMIEKKFKHASIVLNGENLLDARQRNFLIPPVNNPAFQTLWGPIDGKVINLSLVLRF
ncbi:MAG: TonB-dependent receptor [Bacteroidetes bacterium]|nr:MAG: TonB-dependent receptor [Bacteroidota bacterium]